MAIVEVNRRGPVPPYRQIAAQLRRRIEAGEFSPDVDPLPSRNEIKQETGVAETTVDRALEVLREEGLIYTVPGRGSFVRSGKGT